MPTRDPRSKMPVRGDRGFPSRREMSGWLPVSSLLRSAWLGEGSRGESLGARGGLPAPPIRGLYRPGSAPSSAERGRPPSRSLLRATPTRRCLALGPEAARTSAAHRPLSLLRAQAQPSLGPEHPSCPASAQCPNPLGATRCSGPERFSPAPSPYRGTPLPPPSTRPS